MEQMWTDKRSPVCHQDRMSVAKFSAWFSYIVHLVEKVRTDAGRNAEPSYALIDSQSVKTVADNEERGIDGGEKQKAENGISL